MRKRTIDRTGEMMGTMEILSFARHFPGSGNSMWNARCTTCGYETIVMWRNKVKGHGCKSCHGKDHNHNVKYLRSDGSDLYMIRCGDFVKVGTTSNIDVRLRTVQAANPHELELVGLWKGMGHKEQEWHEALKPYHVRGEWYNWKGGACEL